MSTRRANRNRHRNPSSTGVSPVAPALSAVSSASASPSPSSHPDFSEIGFSGTQSWGGLIRDDYNPDLCFPRSISVYEKMRKSDGQVQAIETVCALPARTVRYYVTPAGTGKADKAAADLVEENLLNGVGMSQSFDDFAREALVALMMGYAIFEKCFVESGGQIRWAKFASRHPRSLKQWVFDQGAVAGFVQWGVDPQGVLRTETIGPDKLLRYTYREEWGNPEGFPLSRAMYKHWSIKDSVYRAANVGINRDLVSTPQGQWPAGVSDEDKRNFLEMLKDISVGDSSAMAYGPGYDVKTYGGNSQPNAVMAYLKHHDEAMTRVALASFINLAGAGQGSNALSEDQSQFFLLCEEALATWLCGVLNQQAIPQLCGWNWPGMKVFPRVEHAHMGTILHPVAIAHALAALVNKELLSPDEAVENAVRDMMNLPEIPAGQRRAAPPDPGTPPTKPPSSERGGNATPSPFPLSHRERAGVRAPLPLIPITQADGSPGYACPICAKPLPFSPLPVAALQETPGEGPRVRQAVSDLSQTRHSAQGDGGPDLSQTRHSPQGDGGQNLPLRKALKPDLDKIRADLDEKQADFIEQGTAVLEKVVAWAESAIVALADEAAALPALQRGMIQTRLAELDLPYRGEYQDWLRGLLMGVVNAGMEQLRESRRTGVSPVSGLPPASEDLVIPNELRSYVRALSQVTTDKHFEDLRFAVVTKAQRDIESRLGRDDVRFNTRQTLLDQASANLAQPLQDILRAVTDQVAGILLTAGA